MNDYPQSGGKLDVPQTEAPRQDPWIHRSHFMRCRTCIFYVRKGDPSPANTVDRGLGRCRRHAPVVQLGYPAVYADDWCGDHKMDETKR